MNSSKLSIRWRVALAIATALVVAPASASSAMSPRPNVAPPDATAFGRSYGEWGASWWQWALGAPIPVNPVLDATGEDCGVGQSGEVWFLAGTFGGSATRSCVVPAGKALFLPVLNYTFIATEPEETEDFVHSKATARIDGVDTSLLAAEIDGVSVNNLAQYRAHSPTFSVTLPDDNIFGAPSGTYGPAAADGFWLLLTPLSPGSHVIHFHGVFPSGSTVDTTYHLNVSQSA